MIIGGMAKISSGGFSEVLTIHMNGRIIKIETAISKPYIKISVNKMESRRVSMAFS
jgi:hypothetical protein